MTGVALGRYARHKEGLDALPRKKRPFHAPYFDPQGGVRSMFASVAKNAKNF